MSNRLMPFGEVFAQVEKMSQNHHDEHVPVDTMHFESLDTLRIGNQYHTLKPTAQRQLSTRLGIPHSYLQRCEPDLQAENLNRWLEKERNDQLFVRFNGPEVRAVFTLRYTPVDNLAVLLRLNHLGFDGGTQVQASLDDEFMLLNIPSPHRTFQVKRNDGIQPGISITNSEVGLAALGISAYCLRLICTNGLISQSEVKNNYRHISNRILSEFPSVIEQVTSNLDQQRNQWAISIQSPVEDPLSTLKTFNRQYQLSEREEEAVNSAWPYEINGQPTMFNIVNTYTRAAQHPRLSVENRVKLQKTGGSILAMLN